MSNRVKQMAAAVARPGNKYSLSFDGVDDYVSFPFASGNISQTLGAWVKTNAFSDNKWLFDSGDGTNGGFQVFINATTGKWRFRIDDTGANGAAIDTNTSVATGEWSHIVARIDKSDVMEIFINGSPDGAQIDISGYGDISGSLASFLLGVNENVDSEKSWDGLIDDFRVYDRLLTNQEIAGLSNGREISSGLFGYWKFSEGSGASALDSVGSNNGTINGATYATDTPF